jgi:hypothetical protein
VFSGKKEHPHREEIIMPVILIPAIIGGSVILLGGGYWLMHLH